MRPDLRALSEVLAAPPWDGLRQMAVVKGLTVQQVRCIDRLLCVLEHEGVRHVDDIRDAHIRRAGGEARTEDFYVRLWKALWALLPGALVVRVAQAVAQEIRAKRTAHRRRPRKARVVDLEHSVPEEELPTAWQLALRDMRAGMPGALCRAPSAKMVPTISTKLRQLAHATKKRGLDPEFALAAFKALEDDLKARGVAMKTLESTFTGLTTFARYIGCDARIREYLSRSGNHYRPIARLQPKRKHAHLHRIGASPVSPFAKAKQLLAEAKQEPDAHSANAKWNDALALALFVLIPQRLADTRLVFGRSLRFQGGAWEISIRTSKNRVLFESALDPRLNQFIEAVLLKGLDQAYLETVRHDAETEERPVFTTVTGKGVCKKYVSICWQRHFGTGVHIARSMIHEFLADLDGTAGTETALFLCAQEDPRTADHYKAAGADRASVRRSHLGLQAIAAEIPDAAWHVEDVCTAPSV